MKKNPVKKFLSVASLVAFLIVALSISACSSSESGASEETVPEEPQYAVQIFVDCEQNLMFSKYDVDVSVDGEIIGNVDHGGEATFEVSLTKGQHELVFKEEGASEPDGKVSFVVEGEGDRFSYRISCTKDQIEVEPLMEGAEPAEEEPTEGEKAAIEPEAVEQAEEEAAGAEAEDAERAELDGCVGDTADHAREAAKAVGRTPYFRYPSFTYGNHADTDVESGKYEGAMQRAKVTEVSYGLFGDVTFTLDRPLAVSAEDDEELRALLQLEDPHDDTVYPLYKEHWGTNIEFDGQVMKVEVEGSEANPYYHIVVRPVDLDSGQVSGPVFRFDYVRHDDPSFEGVSLSEIVEGSDVHVIAMIDDYNGVRKQIELTPLQISPL